MLDEFLSDLRTRNPLLYRFGWIHLFLVVIAFFLMFLDPTVITGLNAWIKPMKFALSIAIYSWTYAWVLHYIPESKRRFISRGIVVCMTVEIVLIWMQAARGVRSHFNISTPFDDIVFGVMGLFIMINSFLNLYTLILFLRNKIDLDPIQLSAWRSGLTFFVLGTISGGIMSGVLRHAVGAPDDGPAIPFLNWSTTGGDIRSAHFFTLHGLQAIPFAAMLFKKISQPGALVMVRIFAVAYLIFCIWLHWLALGGQPLIAMP